MLQRFTCRLTTFWLTTIIMIAFAFSANVLYSNECKAHTDYSCKVRSKKPLENKQNHYQVAICAIFQNDAPYMKEWIEFHKIQGVQHFYLYNNNSSDEFQKTLMPYIKTGEVTLVNWPYSYDHADGSTWNDIQSGSYNNCLKLYGNQADWIAFIDTDEFLFCPSGMRLNHFLNKYKEYGGVTANWLMFGTSYVYDLKDTDLMIDLLVRCAKTSYHSHIHVKSIVQPKYVSNFQNPHYAFYNPGKYAVESDFTRIDGPYSSTIKLDEIRINHYWVRTERYLHEVKIPRRNHMYGEDPSIFIKYVEELNQETDAAILQFVPELKKRLM